MSPLSPSGRGAISAAALLLLLALGHRAAAAEDEAPLEELVVTAPRVPLGAGSGSVTVLDGKDLAAKEARTAADALRYVPGAWVSTAPLSTTANGKQEVLLTLRGFEATQVKVLVDGVPVEDPYQGTVDLARLPIEGIDRVTIARGPTSLLYGPNALGGVVNLVSARPGLRTTARLRAELDDVLARRLGGRLSVPIGPVGLFAAFHFGQQDGVRVPYGFEAQRNEDGGVRHNTDAQEVSVLGKAAWDFAPLGRLQLTSHFVDYCGGVPFSVSAVEPATAWRRCWQRLQLETAGLLRPLEGLTVRAKAFYTRFENTVTTYDDATLERVGLDGAAVSTHLHQGVGAFVHPELRLGDLARLSVAASWRLDWMDIRADEQPDTKSRAYRSETLSVAFEGHVRPVDALTITAGASYVGLFKEKAAGAATGADLDDFELLVGLRARLWPGGELHVGWARKVGLPRLRELYGAFGDPDLRPQHASVVQAGVAQELTWDRLALSLVATWFRNDVRDYIAKHDTGNEVAYRNVAEALIEGVELAATARVDDWLVVDAAYTWLHTRDLRPERVVDRLDFQPAHTVDLGLRASLSCGFDGGIALRYLSERLFERPTPAGAVRNAFPGRVGLDLHLAQTFRVATDGRPGRWVRVYARLANLLDAVAAATRAFDVYHEDAPERPGIGWSLRVGIEVAL